MNSFDTEAVYAKALFHLAVERNAVSEWIDLLDQMKGFFIQYPHIFKYFASPLPPPEQKEALFLKAFKASLPTELLNYNLLLLAKRRFIFFLEIAIIFKKLGYSKLGIVEGVVTTATSLDPIAKEKLAEKWGTILNKKVLLCEEVDESLIGGGVLTIQDQRIDFSLKGKLQRLKTDLRGQYAFKS